MCSRTLARPLCALLLAARLPVPQCYLVPLLCMTVIHLSCVHRQRPTPNNTRLAPHRTPIEKRAVGRGKREGSQRDKDRCIRCGSYWDGSIAQRHGYSPTFNKNSQVVMDGLPLASTAYDPAASSSWAPHVGIQTAAYAPIATFGLCPSALWVTQSVGCVSSK